MVHREDFVNAKSHHIRDELKKLRGVDSYSQRREQWPMSNTPPIGDSEF